MSVGDRRHVFAIVLAGGGGQAPGAADPGSRQAGGAVRRQLPPGRLRAVQPRQRRLPADRGAHAVQEPLAGPPPVDHLAAVAAARQLRGARARPDAPRPALVPGLGRRHLPEPQPAARRAAGHRRRLRRRSHLPHGPRADGAPAHRVRRRRDGGGAARPARAGRPVRRHRDGGRRAHDHRLSREAQARGRAARRAPPGLCLDGQLRVRLRHADRRGAGRRRGA